MTDEQAALIARYNAAPKVTRDLVRAILGMTTPKDRERDDAGEPWGNKIA